MGKEININETKTKVVIKTFFLLRTSVLYTRR